MFRGEYKKISVNGAPIAYDAGDYVLYQGKLLKAKIPTIQTPWEIGNDWEYSGSSQTFISETAPINPVKGQMWIKNEKMYVYYYDGDSFSWVEV